MAEWYTYTKYRSEFDHWPLNFKDTEVRLIEPEIKVDEDEKEYPYVKSDPNFVTLSNIPEYS
jgi:hypothetical protein